MKMNHLSKEKVDLVMSKVREVVASGNYTPDKMEEIFDLSEVDGAKFIECKNNPLQRNRVNFEINADDGIRFFDPFNFYTRGIYKDMDGWSRWTMDNLKEPWT